MNPDLLLLDIGQGSGLGPTEITKVPLPVGTERRVNLVLQPAAQAEQINVASGELAVIDTASAAVGTNVNAREVATLPLNGRQLSQLYLLAPGAQTAGGGSFDNIRFSGRANQENAVRFDGIEASSIIDSSPGNLNGEISTGFRLQNSLETVSEFRVDSSNYPAEFGTGTAGQISVISKSGGNEFHGGLFEYIRNDKLDTRNFFDTFGKTPLRLNQYGGSVGGAIKKEKLFFFIAQESLRQRAGLNLIATVPSASARARAVPSIQPLLAGYPAGTPTSNPDLDLARRRLVVDRRILRQLPARSSHQREVHAVPPLQPRSRLPDTAPRCHRFESDRYRRSAERSVYTAAGFEPGHD